MGSSGEGFGKQKPIQNKSVFRLIVKNRWWDKV